MTNEYYVDYIITNKYIPKTIFDYDYKYILSEINDTIDERPFNKIPLTNEPYKYYLINEIVSNYQLKKDTTIVETKLDESKIDAKKEYVIIESINVTDDVNYLLNYYDNIFLYISEIVPKINIICRHYNNKRKITKEASFIFSDLYENILSSIELDKEKLSISTTKREKNEFLLDRRNRQIEKCVLYCHRYGIPIKNFYKSMNIFGEEKLITIKEQDKKHLFPYKKGTNYTKLQITNVGLYSITLESEAEAITKILKEYIDPKKSIITDGTSGMGGNIFNFAKYFKQVNAIEYSKIHCDIIKNNIEIYNFKNVNVYCGNYLDYLELKEDCLFLDPPWGGKYYKELDKTYLWIGSYMIDEIINIKKDTKVIAIKVPNNFDMEYFNSNTPNRKRKVYDMRKKYKLIILI